MSATTTTTPNQVVSFSFDIEADGQSPALNSMLSIGIVAYNESGKEIDTFQINLEPIPGHVQEERCMREFWDKEPEAWKFVNTNRVPAERAIMALEEWLKKYNQFTWNWIARPASYDWMWLKYYHEKFGSVNRRDIGYQCICLSTIFKTYCILNRIKDKEAFEKELTTGEEVTHNPLDDARYQGKLFFELKKKLNSC